MTETRTAETIYHVTTQSYSEVKVTYQGELYHVTQDGIALAHTPDRSTAVRWAVQTVDAANANVRTRGYTWS